MLISNVIYNSKIYSPITSRDHQQFHKHVHTQVSIHLHIHNHAHMYIYCYMCTHFFIYLFRVSTRFVKCLLQSNGLYSSIVVFFETNSITDTIDKNLCVKQERNCELFHKSIILNKHLSLMKIMLINTNLAQGLISKVFRIIHFTFNGLRKLHKKLKKGFNWSNF